MKRKLEVGRLSLLLWTLFAALALCAVAQACNVPVFRYALERWHADRYRATVFHRGPLSEADRETLRALNELEENALANLEVRLVDVEKFEDEKLEDQADTALSNAGDKVEFPRCVLQYPEKLQIEKPIWAGPAARESIAALADSPVREELVRRLADGQTAVWLLLECGKPEKDDAAEALLERELARLEKELKLPVLTDAPQDNLLTSAPLEIRFTPLRVSRSDAKEQVLVNMLLGSEPDLAERTDDPMIFPVFGRGRALFALIGAGITAENIQSSAEFLAGACSCEVKELNPGFDLLLAADWETLLFQDAPPTAVPTRNVAATTDEAVLVPIPKGSKAAARPAAPPTAATSGFNQQFVYFAGIGFAVALLFIAGLASTRR